MAEDTIIKSLVFNDLTRENAEIPETREVGQFYIDEDKSLEKVAHDSTLSGDGTEENPLKVVGGGSNSDNNGLEGDYATTYGIVDETTSGLPYIKSVGSTTVVIPAGLVMDIPGVAGLSTNTTKIEYEVQSTENPTLFLANGTVIEAVDVFFQVEEPEDGTSGFAAWWNGTTWQFKSNDTGNVWRPANAVRIVKCVFTGTSLTRLCFTGCRVLNRQEFATKEDLSKFLMNKTTASNSVAVGTTGNITSTSTIAIGCHYNINATGAIQLGQYNQNPGMYSIALGFSPKSGGYKSIALGYTADALGSESIQLGDGTNSENNTFQVFDYQMLNSNGKIPFERLEGVVKQFNTMPKPYSIQNDIVQYIGNTTSEYTNGYWYKWSLVSQQDAVFNTIDSSEITITNPNLFYTSLVNNTTWTGSRNYLVEGDTLTINRMGDTFDIDIRTSDYNQIGHCYLMGSGSQFGLSAPAGEDSYSSGEFELQQLPEVWNWVQVQVQPQYPEVPEADGTYVLKAVKSGTSITYQWVSE